MLQYIDSIQLLPLESVVLDPGTLSDSNSWLTLFQLAQRYYRVLELEIPRKPIFWPSGIRVFAHRKFPGSLLRNASEIWESGRRFAGKAVPKWKSPEIHGVFRRNFRCANTLFIVNWIPISILNPFMSIEYKTSFAVNRINSLWSFFHYFVHDITLTIISEVVPRQIISIHANNSFTLVDNCKSKMMETYSEFEKAHYEQ